jgi:hypothetical protein
MQAADPNVATATFPDDEQTGSWDLVAALMRISPA